MSHRGRRSFEAYSRRIHESLAVAIMQRVARENVFFEPQERETVYVGSNLFVATRVTLPNSATLVAEAEVWQGEVLRDSWGTGSLQ
jgi:hypothetical protein